MNKLTYILIILILGGCKEKYDLPFSQPDTGYLVIEGIINSGADSTRIELSRTNKINNTQKQYESGAVVQVEGDDNTIAALTEKNNTGVYINQLNLDQAKKYRLRIKTSAGKEYLSEFVAVKMTPAIDSISWQRENNGVRLFFNTHDAQNNTKYYQWDYVETWEFHSPYRSVLKYVPKVDANGNTFYTIGYKDSVSYSHDTLLYKCWKNTRSSEILLGSSARLSSDIIYQQPFLKIPPGDEKISVLYSIYVKQYAVTKEGYEFLEKMKRNTEQNGSIFDAQPSELKGNIQCVTDPAEPVIGFINVSSATDKRIFIKNTELPGWNYKSGCDLTTVRNNPDSIKQAFTFGLLPTEVLATGMVGIIYFGAAEPPCVECTRTGTNNKPSFWP